LAPTSAGRERLARYANRITRHETDTDSGVEVARDMYFLKGYTVFNVEQNRAFYRPSTDSIVLPLFEAFCDPESYYATLAHETTHWTAHESRLARDFGTKRFGSEGYAIEELVAELGAAFLCADLDLTLEPREDHAAYIANWLDVLKTDNRAIFAAASHAQQLRKHMATTPE
jgi:antirestriction protein ArdC